MTTHSRRSPEIYAVQTPSPGESGEMPDTEEVRSAGNLRHTQALAHNSSVLLKEVILCLVDRLSHLSASILVS